MARAAWTHPARAIAGVPARGRHRPLVNVAVPRERASLAATSVDRARTPRGAERAGAPTRPEEESAGPANSRVIFEGAPPSGAGSG